jgi:hypothetical protein
MLTAAWVRRMTLASNGRKRPRKVSDAESRRLQWVLVTEVCLLVTRFEFGVTEVPFGARRAHSACWVFDGGI